MQESIFKKTNKMPLSFNVDLLTLNEGIWNTIKATGKAIKDTGKDFLKKVNKNADISITKDTIPKLLKFIDELKEDIGNLKLGDISSINDELDTQYELFKDYKIDDEQ